MGSAQPSQPTPSQKRQCGGLFNDKVEDTLKIKNLYSRATTLFSYFFLT